MGISWDLKGDFHCWEQICFLPSLEFLLLMLCSLWPEHTVIIACVQVPTFVVTSSSNGIFLAFWWQNYDLCFILQSCVSDRDIFHSEWSTRKNNIHHCDTSGDKFAEWKNNKTFLSYWSCFSAPKCKLSNRCMAFLFDRSGTFSPVVVVVYLFYHILWYWHDRTHMFWDWNKKFLLLFSRGGYQFCVATVKASSCK